MNGHTPRVLSPARFPIRQIGWDQLARPPGSIQIRPALVTEVRRVDPSHTALESGFDRNLSPGADVNWGITPDVTLQATVNPDFGQVEADQRVLNLATSETYYPESERSFSKESTSSLRRRNWLYTKRIGRETELPMFRSDGAGHPVEAAVNIARPTAIFGAAKLTGRIAESGPLAFSKPSPERTTSSSSRSKTNRDCRLAHGRIGGSMIPRSSARSGSSGTSGAQCVHRDARDRRGACRIRGGVPSVALCIPNSGGAPTGSSIPRDERCSLNAYVRALDGRWRSAAGDYSAFAQATASRLAGGYLREVADGTSIRAGDMGLGATGRVAKDGGRWTGSLWGEDHTPKLDYNDMGFMQRANFAGGGLQVDYRVPDSRGPTLESKTTFASYSGYNTYGIPVGSGIGLGYFARFKNFWSATVFLGRDFAWFDDRELADGRGTALERPEADGYDLVVNSPTTERVSFSLGSRAMHYSTGSQVTAKASALVHVVPQWDLEVVPAVTFARGQPRFAGSHDSEGAPLFGNLQADSFSSILRRTLYVHSCSHASNIWAVICRV